MLKQNFSANNYSQGDDLLQLLNASPSQKYDLESPNYSAMSKTKQAKNNDDLNQLVQCCIQHCYQNLLDLKQQKLEEFIQIAVEGNEAASLLTQVIDRQLKQQEQFYKFLLKTIQELKKKSQAPKIDVCQFNEMIHQTVMESKTDWLALESLMIADHQGIFIPNQAQLAQKIRLVFKQESESLTKDAVENKGLTMQEFTEAARRFYSILPEKIFQKTDQTPRMKSQKPIRRQKKEISIAQTKIDSFIEPVKRGRKKATKSVEPEIKPVATTQYILDQDFATSQVQEFCLSSFKRFKY